MKLVLDESAGNYNQCYNCDAEFKVHSLFDEENDEMTVTFCPFCGEDLDGIEEEELWDDDLEE